MTATHHADGASTLLIDFQTLFTLSPNPYLVLDHSLTIVWMNDAYLRSTMREREAITGLPIFEAFPSDPGTESFQLLNGSLSRVLATACVDELALIPYAIATTDGRMEERCWSATHTPLLDEHGAVAFILQHTVDVTELQNLRKLHQEAGVVQRASAVQTRNTDLLAQTERMHSLFDQAPGFMALVGGADRQFQLANAAYRRLMGGRDVVGKPIHEALSEMADQGFVARLDEVFDNGEPYLGKGERLMIASEDGASPHERYLDFIYQPILDDHGNVTGVFVEGHDVTDEFALLHRQGLLINELNHRVKNTLAIVQGMAAQSFRAVDPTGSARATFDGRLKALAAAHDLLTERSWEPTSLGETIRIAVAASLAEEEPAFDIAGPEVPLAPQHAVALAMAIHELTTNARRYGALSHPAGRVSLTWAWYDAPDGAGPLVIDWNEQGGPPVVPPPRRGFGTRLVERGLSAELEGSAKIDFLSDGLHCRMTLSLPRQPASE